MKTKIPINEQIEDIMNNFDFAKVHRVMRDLDWTYFDSDSTPTVDRLRDTARRLLQNVTEEKSIETGSGGFWARLSKWGLLSLEFVVAEWNIEDENLQA